MHQHLRVLQHMGTAGTHNILACNGKGIGLDASAYIVLVTAKFILDAAVTRRYAAKYSALRRVPTRCRGDTAASHGGQRRSNIGDATRTKCGAARLRHDAVTSLDAVLQRHRLQFSTENSIHSEIS
jgi:hypothetical protein